MSRQATAFKTGAAPGPGRPPGWTTRSLLIAVLLEIDPDDPNKLTRGMVKARTVVEQAKTVEEILSMFKFLDGASPPLKEVDPSGQSKPEAGGIVVPSIDVRHSDLKDRCQAQASD